MSRRALFDFARPLAPNGQLTPAMVIAGDAFADALGLPKADAPANDTAGRIDPARFAAWAPKAVPHTLHALQSAANKHGLTHPLVLAHWLGQNHHESAGFSRLEENLNYSAQRMAEVWPGRYAINARAEKKTPNALAFTLAHKPEALANNVYGGRMGNNRPGDGWRFRGRGFKMITGADNYKTFGYFDNPDALLDVREAADASARFFVSVGGVALAMADDVDGLTLKINGGRIGLADRKVQTARAKQVVR